MNTSENLAEPTRNRTKIPKHIIGSLRSFRLFRTLKFRDRFHEIGRIRIWTEATKNVLLEIAESYNNLPQPSLRFGMLITMGEAVAYVMSGMYGSLREIGALEWLELGIQLISKSADVAVVTLLVFVNGMSDLFGVRGTVIMTLQPLMLKTI